MIWGNASLPYANSPEPSTPSPSCLEQQGFNTLAQLGLGLGPTEPIHISGYPLSLYLRMVEKLFIPKASPTAVPTPCPSAFGHPDLSSGTLELWRHLWGQMGSWRC